MTEGIKNIDAAGESIGYKLTILTAVFIALVGTLAICFVALFSKKVRKEFFGESV